MLESLRAAAPAGMEIRVLLDGSSFIRSSVESVQLDCEPGRLFHLVEVNKLDLGMLLRGLQPQGTRWATA